MSGPFLKFNLDALTMAIRNSLSPHTWSYYSAAWNRWLVFCRTFNFHCFQHSEGAILSILCILMHDHLSHSHIIKMLAGAYFFFKIHKLPPLNVFFSIKKASKGYRKSTYAPDKGRPISVEMLKQLCLSSCQVSHN